MGWDGTFIYYNSRMTNKEIFLRTRPDIKNLVDEKKAFVSQNKSDVFLLFKYDVEGEYYGKWWVLCYLCRREKGREFLTKDIDAIANNCFSFPSSWLKLLDVSDKDVRSYIIKRKFYEERMKAEKKEFEIGNVFHLTAPYEITFTDGHKIKEGEDFFVKIEQSYNAKIKRKLYRIVYKNFNEYSQKIEYSLSYYKISKNLFEEIRNKQREVN